MANQTPKMPRCRGILKTGKKAGQQCPDDSRPGEAFCKRHGDTSEHRAIAVKNQAAWLAAYRRGCNIYESCDAAGVAYSTYSAWSNTDPDFWQAEELEYKRRVAAGDQEIHRRGFEGVRRLRYDKNGNVIGEDRIYSDRCALAWQKAHNRELYGDKVEVTHVGQEAVLALAPILDAAARELGLDPTDKEVRHALARAVRANAGG